MLILLLVMDTAIGNWHCSGRLVAVFLIFIVAQVYSADAEKGAATLFFIYGQYCLIF